MRCTIGCVVVMTIAFAASVQAAALTQTINPVADAFVAASNPGNNYGAAGGLGLSFPGAAKGEFQSVMRFDLSAAKALFDSSFGVGNWSIQSVTLKLVAATPNNAIFNANAAGQFAVRWMQNDSWAEGTGTPMTPTSDGITFNTLPGFLSGSDTALGSFAYNGASSGSNTYTLATDASFIGDLTAGGNVSLQLLAADNAVSYLFNSRNNPTASTRPELAVTADVVPEPAALGVIGIVAFALHRRWR